MLPSRSPIAAIKPAVADVSIDSTKNSQPAHRVLNESGVLSRKVLLCAHWSECQTHLATKVSLYTVSQKVMLN